MNKKLKKKSKIVFLMLAVLLLASCGHRPANVLSSSEMEALLADIHLLEATIQQTGGLYGEEDQKAYYTALLKKHKITEADFDSCISWYTRHPKKFERVYINVERRLDRLADDVNNFKYHPYDTLRRSNIWPLKSRYFIKVDSLRDKIEFDIDASDFLPYDRYELSFLHRVAPRDSSSNQRVVMYITYSDGMVDSIFTRTPNDSIMRRITLKFSARQMKKLKSISGNLLGYDTPKGKPFSILDSVRLYRSYNPQHEAAIRSVLEQISLIDSITDGKRKEMEMTMPSRDDAGMMDLEDNMPFEDRVGSEQILDAPTELKPAPKRSRNVNENLNVRKVNSKKIDHKINTQEQ